MIYTPGNISLLPETSGVYKFFDKNGQVLYIGESNNLKKRIRSYFVKTSKETKTAQLVNLIHSISVIPVASEFEALLLEAELIRKHQPKYNVIWKDGKHYIYIHITDEEFPTVHLARRQINGHGHYFGPFPSASIVREILKFLRTIFPYCTQKAALNHPCFYTHLRLCNPCPAIVRKLSGDLFQKSKQEYRRNIIHIIQLLKGSSRTVEKNLQKDMLEFSKKEEYESAAEVRSKIRKIDYLLTQFSSPSNYMENPHFAHNQRIKEEEELIRILCPYYPLLKTIKHIECYDISNISGSDGAGSMVTFMKGQSTKQYYRKFKIRFTKRPNDFAMLSEVLDRRFNHLEWKLPHLIVIDGGKPQLIAVQKIFHARHITIPVIGLAKKEEEIVIPKEKEFVKVRLGRGSPALHLIQRVRDEAHRFSHAYHEKLRIHSFLPT